MRTLNVWARLAGHCPDNWRLTKMNSPGRSIDRRCLWRLAEEFVRPSCVLYCRAGCESSRPFGFQGTPPRDLGGVLAFWPTFRRVRQRDRPWAGSLPCLVSITGSDPLGPHGRDLGPKSLRVSLRRVPGLRGVGARESAADEVTSVPRRSRVDPPTSTRRFTSGQIARRLHREPLPARALHRLAGAPDANSEPRDHDARRT